MQVALLSLLVVGLVVGGEGADCGKKDIRDCLTWRSMKLCGKEPYTSKCPHACGGCKLKIIKFTHYSKKLVKHNETMWTVLKLPNPSLPRWHIKT